MKKINFIRLILLLFAFGPASCSSFNPASINSLSGSGQFVKGKFSIEGSVEFPDSSLPSLIKRGAGGELTTKATTGDISTTTTISLIYGPDNPSSPNITAITGITNANGKFFLNSDSTFVPSNGEVFVLEASKRPGGLGKNIISVRTFIRWDGEKWDSITKPVVVVNSKTTAVTLLLSLNHGIPLNSAIGKITVQGNNSLPDNFSGITSGTVFEVANLVEQVLAKGDDPFSKIKFINEKYIIENFDIEDRLIETNSCVGCDFTGKLLSGIDLSNKILDKAILSGFDLSEKNFSGSQLNETDLSYSNLKFADFSENQNLHKTKFIESYLYQSDFSKSNLLNANFNSAYLEGANFLQAVLDNVNFTDADLRGVDLSLSSLANTNFSSSNLSGVNFMGTDISTANFSNADLSSAIWIDGHTCPENSIGECL